jgi:signal transduction histidine kinase
MGDAVWALGMLTLAWLLGWAVRTRQHRIGALESAADAARRRHAEEVARATAAERAAIARELHDIVAHAVAVIVIQAQVGRRALPHDPGLAADVFQTVEDSGRAALVELRRLLSLLSDDAMDSSLEPVASLRRLPDLIATFRSAGLQVDCTAPDVLPPLSPTADLTAYRVVQQALTNTLHHAPGSSARVVLRCTGDELDIVADDDGPGRPHLAQPTASAGRGLIGMRERLALVGGVLVCAEPGERGFRVHARIPVEHPVEALTGTGS